MQLGYALLCVPDLVAALERTVAAEVTLMT